MQGVRIIDIDTTYGRSTIEWIYEGKLTPKIDPIHCDPGFIDLEDIANLIMSIFIPSLAAVGEGINFGKLNLSAVSLNYWRKKLDSLKLFYRNYPFIKDVRPISTFGIPRRKGDRTALLWGGGADSCMNAIDLVSRGIKPILIHIQRSETDWNPDGMFQKCLKEIAKILDLEHVVVKSNALDVQRNFWNSTAEHLNHDTCWNWGCVMAPHDRRSTSHIISGLAYFFTALGGLPKDMTEIVMSGAADDPWESYGYGADFWDATEYRGIRMVGKCVATKVEEYGILFKNYPEIAKWMKPCWDDRVQWCGQCKKCREAALMLKANKLPVPFDVKPARQAKAGGLFKLGRLLAALYHYRKFPEREYEVEKELSEAVYETAYILAERAKIQ